MLSEELLEAQNAVTQLNTLFYRDDEADADGRLDMATRYGAMLVQQFEDCFNEYLNATEEFYPSDAFDRDDPNHLDDFIQDNLRTFQLKSLVSLSEMIAVFKAQKPSTDDNTAPSVKKAFSLTAENTQTLSSLKTFTQSKLHAIRMEMLNDENSTDNISQNPEKRTITVDTGDENAEFWGDLHWANTLFKDPSHAMHKEYARYNGFHIGPAMERAIVTTREYLEFFSSIYFYMQKQSGENDTDIPQEKIDTFTQGADEMSTIVIALRNLACNDSDIVPDDHNIEMVAQAINAQYGALRIH